MTTKPDSKQKIRNFCIVAHIDHGKSTLADRFLEISGVIDKDKLSEQMLDRMELEKERGITIKAKATTLPHTKDGQTYNLNLIDTPGHVDFSYEVAKSIKASDGVILLVDASQGVEAQTVANFYLALERDVKVIPVINKIDLLNANPERVIEQLEEIFGFKREEISLVSAKKGTGVREVIERVIDEVPPPIGNKNQPLKAILFDTSFDPYRGIILFVRIFDGTLSVGDEILLMHNQKKYQVEDLGFFVLSAIKRKKLSCGEVGYLVCNIKDPQEVDAGDTITKPDNPTKEPFEGYKKIPPMVFCGIFPSSPADYPALRKAVEKLQLSDPSFVSEPDNLGSLGYGFRCGFLGLLHMEVIQERLEREFNLDLILTSPNVLYRVKNKKGELKKIRNPYHFPDPAEIETFFEPYTEATIVTPIDCMDAVFELCKSRRGEFIRMDYLGKDRLNIFFDLPLAEIVIDFYDKIKSITRGYASFDYEFKEYRETEIVKIDVMINSKPIEAFSILTHKTKSEDKAREIAQRLKNLIPRQMFELKIQAVIGSKVIASSKVPALRKNVTAKCYGGDVTRKRKLWEKQKKGKKKMKQMGNLQLPKKVFLEVLKI